MLGLGQLANTTGAVGNTPGFRTASIDASKPSKGEEGPGGIEDGDAADDVCSRANAPRPGFTKNDQKDMYRMGKIQELRVRCATTL